MNALEHNLLDSGQEERAMSVYLEMESHFRNAKYRYMPERAHITTVTSPSIRPDISYSQ
jgi:hypothetical protein